MKVENFGLSFALLGLFVTEHVNAQGQGTLTPMVPHYKLLAGKLNTIRWEAKNVAQKDTDINFELCSKEEKDCVVLADANKPYGSTSTVSSGFAVLSIPETTKPGPYSIKMTGANIAEASVDVVVDPPTLPGFRLNIPPRPWPLGKNITLTWTSNPPGSRMMGITLCIGKGADLTPEKCLFKKAAGYLDGFIEVLVDPKWIPAKDFYSLHITQGRLPGRPILNGPFEVAQVQEKTTDADDSGDKIKTVSYSGTYAISVPVSLLVGIMLLLC